MNLNDYVTFKLTKYGIEAYNNYVSVTKDIIANYNDSSAKFVDINIDENGYSTIQLWNFMQIFGNYVGIEHPQIIVSNELIMHII